MKKLSFIPLLSLIFVLNVASTCSNDDDGNTETQQDPTSIINIASEGTWHISLYEDDSIDETHHFTGFNFTFNNSNILTATNGTDIYTGSWSVTNDDSDDDSPSNDLDFNIFFSSPASFADELSDDWDIVSYSSTKIELVDVSGGNGGTDYLTFVKN